MRLASKDLFQRCLRGATQNAESFNGLVWSHCLYGNFVELIQWNACSLVVLQFNNCAKAIQDILEEMGCSVGEYNMNPLELEDRMQIRKCDKKETQEQEF